MMSLKKEVRLGNGSIKNKEISQHRINKKADVKLGVVADIFEKVLGDRFVKTRKTLLHREIECRGFRYVKSIKLDYESYENRMWAFSYNLNISVSLDASEYTEKETERCAFKGKAKGKMDIKDAEWLDNGSECSSEQINRYLSRLNNKFIVDRMVKLDMNKMKLDYDPVSNYWSAGFTSLIGSSTWIMIPPVMQLIRPKPEECAMAVEFFELLFSAVVNAGKKDGRSVV